MNPKPAASIIIPVLNGEKTIPDLLVALKGQAGVPGGIEVIVVDNGSTDRTVEVVRAHGFAPLHQPRRGPSAARNLGLAHAQADVIICIDSDCVPTRRLVATLVAAMADPQVGIATGPIHGWQPTTGAERFVSCRDAANEADFTEKPLHAFAFGMHTTFRRQEGLELGGWDEAMGSGEDVDFCYRYRKRFGKPIRYFDQAILFHKHRSSDEALWKQAHWHGAGYALVQSRHPEIIKTTPLRVYLTLALMSTSSPIVWLGRKLRFISRERADFEWYHRHWWYCYWIGYLQERRKGAA